MRHDSEPITVGFASNIIAVAGEQYARGRTAAAHADAARLAGGGDDHWQVVAVAAGRVVLEALAQLWRAGWQPTDLHQTVRRRASDHAVSVVLDAIALDVGQHRPETVDARWRDQVGRLGARVWWNPDAPHLSQWARQRGHGRSAAVTAVIELVAVIARLPALPIIMPPPGQGSAPTSRRADGGSRQLTSADDAVLARVRALLAKAESTSFPAEAEALSAKAQELMSRHSVEHALLRADGADTAVASARRVWLEPPYTGPKCLLVHEVAGANRCRSVADEKLGFVTVLGDEPDLDAVETLTTSLMVQATSAMLSRGSRIGAGGRSRTRSFRHSFLLAYATRVGERLRQTAQAQVSDAGSALVPVLARRDQAIDDLFGSLFPRTSTRSWSTGNADGWGAGRAAADSAAILRRGVIE